MDVFTQGVLDEMDPAVALFWSLEPDSSHHEYGVGSEMGNRALAAADRQFGRLVEWLDGRGRLARTDVLVASDHGYATVTEAVHVEGLVESAGFPSSAERGGVMVASNGGSVLFYVARHDRETADRLAAWLMAQPWCGSIVASEASGSPEGTLPAGLIGIEGERAPDLAMSFAWDSEPNAGGYPGRIFSTSKMPGQGNHGSMSRHEQRCAFIARGPRFKSGARVDTPSGNVDVMPTVLALLGIDPLAPVDGRVLEEGLDGGPGLYAPLHPHPPGPAARGQRDVPPGHHRLHHRLHHLRRRRPHPLRPIVKATLTKLVILGAPLALGLVEVFHIESLPFDSEGELRPFTRYRAIAPVAEQWLVVHLLQAPLIALVGLAVYLAVRGLADVPAAIARVCMALFVVGLYRARLGGRYRRRRARRRRAGPAPRPACRRRAGYRRPLESSRRGQLLRRLVHRRGARGSWEWSPPPCRCGDRGAPRGPVALMVVAAFIFGLSHANPFGPMGMACLLAAFAWLEFFPQASLSLDAEKPNAPEQPQVEEAEEPSPDARPARRRRRSHRRR